MLKTASVLPWMERETRCRTRFDEPLTTWRVSQGEVQLRTERNTYSARRVVFAGGAWSQSILGNTIPKLNVLRKVQVWYSAQQLDVLPEPAFYVEDIAGGFYGVSTPASGQIKIAEHTVTQDSADPNDLDRQLWDSDAQRLNQLASQFLRSVDPAPLKHAVCMYTMSPDGHFILDRHPDYESVFLAAGFSGHGFKFASVIGKALADCVTQGHTLLPISFLGLHRFR